MMMSDESKEIDAQITSVVDSFCLDDWTVISSLSDASSSSSIEEKEQQKNQEEENNTLDQKSKLSLYKLVPSYLHSTVDAMENRIGWTVDALIDQTPQQVKDFLAASILLALKYAICGVGSADEKQASSSISLEDQHRAAYLIFGNQSLVTCDSAETEADTLWKEYGLEKAAEVAFDKYLGSKIARAKLLAFKNLPAHLGLIYSLFVRIRFFAIVAHLYGFPLDDEHILTLVAFAALDVPVDPTIFSTQKQIDNVVAQQVQDAITEEISSEIKTLALETLAEVRLYRVTQAMLKHSIRSIATSEVGKYFSGIYLVYTFAQSLMYDQAPLIRARTIFADPDLKAYMKTRTMTTPITSSSSSASSVPSSSIPSITHDLLSSSSSSSSSPILPSSSSIHLPSSS